MKSGTARLYKKNGDYIAKKRYLNKIERIIMPDYWAKIYGEGMRDTFITYEPEVSPNSVSENGTNQMCYYKKKKKNQNTLCSQTDKEVLIVDKD